VKQCAQCADKDAEIERLVKRTEKLLLQNANLLSTIEDLETKGDLVYLFEQDAIVDELARHIWPRDSQDEDEDE